MLTVLAYMNSLYADYQFDDLRVILNDGFIKNFDNFSNINTWTTVNLRPFSLFTFALNYQLHGINVFGFHVTNIVIHLCSVILVYLLTIQLFSITNIRASRISLLLPAMIFALHPMQTQAVTYIVQRMTSLSVLFYLGALVAYLQLRTVSGKNLLLKIPVYALITALCVILSILTKQIGLSVVVVFAAMEMFVLSHSGKKLPLVFAGLYAAVITAGIGYVIINDLLPLATRNISRYDYFITQLHILPVYFRLFFTGYGLNIDHFVLPLSTLSPNAYLGISIYILAVSLLFFRINPIIKLALLFFIATMLVESSIIPIDDILVEHRWYLTIVPLSLIITSIYNHFCMEYESKSYYIGVLVLALLLGVGTTFRNADWDSKLSLWNDSLLKNPDNPRAQNNYAQALMLEERFEESIPYLLNSIAINPKKNIPLTNVSISYSYIGNWDRAEYFLKIAENGMSFKSETLFARGIYYLKRGDLSHARLKFSDAIRADYLNYDARQKLVETLLLQGEVLASREQESALLTLNPEYFQVLIGDYR